MKRTRSNRRSTRLEEARKRTTSGKENAEPAACDYFATLPSEIATHIVELACSSSTTTTSSSSSSSSFFSAAPPHSLDITTTLSLILVSHSFYNLVAPLLFRVVWLSRPSALESFLTALEAHPHAGALVKNLYVGPDDPLPENHYPSGDKYSDDDSDGSTDSDEDLDDGTFMRTSLQSPEEVKLLPRWCTPGHRWMVARPGPSAPEEAVYDALAGIQVVIDEFPPGYFVSGEDRDESCLRYNNRLWEIQAALDLYLIQLRRWEDQWGIVDACSVPKADLTYPPLVLTGYPKSTPHEGEEGNGDEDEESHEDEGEDIDDIGDDNGDEDDSSAPTPWHLSRAQLLQHLARPRSLTDRFDHPLTFARSSIEPYAHDPPGRAEQRAADIFTALHSPPDPLLPRTASVSSNLGLLCSILARTPQIETLGLSGFLSLSLCACNPSPPSLPHLKNLSIGPGSGACRFGRQPLQPFLSLEELRLCDMKLDDEAELASLVNRLPRLQRLQASFASESYDVLFRK